MGEKRCIQGFGGEPEERDHFEEPGVDGNIILRWIFSSWDGAWTGLIWLKIGTGGCHL